MLQPGQTLGIVGGGQLGRMLAQEARRAGFRVVIFTDEYPQSPAGQVADREINAPYFDPDATADFIADADVITLEFENIPVDFLEALEQRRPVFPSREALQICQNREREKAFLKSHNIPHAPYEVADSSDTLAAAVLTVGAPCILKTAAFGYDGKGQHTIHEDFNAPELWEKFGAPRGVIEKRINFTCEISVVAARSQDGNFVAFDPVENIHTNSILDTAIAPARISPELADDARDLAKKVAEALDYVGTLAVEMFVTTDNEILVNEIAPRPHNSGHYTIDACHSSQFAQQLHAVADIPLSTPTQHTPAVMINLLGDLWPENGTPDWTTTLAHPTAKLHLYGKRTAKPGRKMGHITVLGSTIEEAIKDASKIRTSLGLPAIEA